MKKIGGIIKYVYNKKRGDVGFKIGNNFTIRTKKRKMFKYAIKAALDKESGVVKSFWDNKRLEKRRF